MLNQTVGHGGNSQLSLSPIWLRDTHAPYRLWLVRAVHQAPPDPGPGVFQVLFGLENIQPIDACGSLVRLHAFPRALHVVSRERLREQVSPCVLRFLSREACFIAGRLGQGFTSPDSDPPRWRGHLMRYTFHRQGV